MKIPILATGLSGLVGTRVKELLSDSFAFTDLSLETGVDITNFEQIEESIQNSPANVILHMAAKTDVDSCEDDKILGEDGAAWLVNVVGTENITTSADKYGKRVVYISTDFVFDGTNEKYSEDDEPNPINWYAQTKYEGENIINKSGISSSILRIAYPYRAKFDGKRDFVRNILERLRSNEAVYGIIDHIFTPTFIDDIASALNVFLKRELPGIYHVVGSQSLTTYDAIRKIADIWHFKARIKKVDRATYFLDRAFRPRKLALKNDKIAKLGIEMRRFDEGLEEVKRQMLM